MNKQEFKSLMTFLVATFPHQEFSAATTEVYWRLLQDLPFDVAEGAALTVASSEEFVSPSKIRGAATELHHSVQGLPEPFEAWATVLEGIREGVGHPQASIGLDFECHEAVAETVRLIGGWNTIAMSTLIGAERARFLQAYKEVCSRYRETINTPPQLKAQALQLALPPAERKALTDAG